MGDENGLYNQELEDRIVRIVNKIKKNRNRACLQNIQTMLERGGYKIALDYLKDFIQGLVDTDVLKNSGTPERISLSVVELAEEGNNVDNVETDSDDNIDKFLSTKELEDFVDNSFYETLLNRIKFEVKNTVKSELDIYLNNNKLNDVKDTNDDMFHNQLGFNTLKDISSLSTPVGCAKECINNHCNNELVEALNKHVDFLQKELLSKDTIINMLIQDKCVSGKELNMNELLKNNSNNNIKSTTVFNPMMNKSKQTIDKSHINGDVNEDKYANEDTSNFITVNSRKKKNTNQRSISIIGDSMLKEMDPYQMRKKLKIKTDKLYVHSFKGATVDHMKYHSQPVMGFDPNMVIIHAGTNSLRGSSTPKQVADEIIELATNLKTDHNEIVVSGIVPRRDNLSEKAEQVNDYLKIKTSTLDIPFIRHTNINTDTHLKPKGLHLNNKGTITLSENFLEFINT